MSRLGPEVQLALPSVGSYRASLSRCAWGTLISRRSLLSVGSYRASLSRCARGALRSRKPLRPRGSSISLTGSK